MVCCHQDSSLAIVRVRLLSSTGGDRSSYRTASRALCASWSCRTSFRSLGHFPYPGFRDFNEWSVYQGWMRQYLRYLHRYVTVAMNPSASLQNFVDPPIFIRTWSRPRVDLSSYRFGIMFRKKDGVSSETQRQRLRSVEDVCWGHSLNTKPCSDDLW